MIKQNLEWERIRYLSTMIHNVNCQKKQQMIKPEKLFPLPQDKFNKAQKPKGTEKDYNNFKDKAIEQGVKF
ncbi:hypothetical protein [uncultured Mediterranean phage uvMED]|jgi:hypothetical protein|nr:hypothetical protein [uncultured Mediterranean phage uvMED]BAQ92604.1 hypothetical protein [uncultured Mediterranean phage uvMED]